MTIESFLAVLDERIPTVDEMGELCDTLEIGFHIVNGVPSLKCNSGNRGEAEVLAKLFRREPFRSAIIEMKLAGATVVPPSMKIMRFRNQSKFPQVPKSSCRMNTGTNQPTRDFPGRICGLSSEQKNGIASKKHRFPTANKNLPQVRRHHPSRMASLPLPTLPR